MLQEETLHSEDNSQGANALGKWRPHPHIETGGLLHKNENTKETKDLIEDFKKDKMKKLNSKKSVSSESDQSSISSNDVSFETTIANNDNTPILQNRHSLMSNSSETSNTSEGGSRINFVSRQNPSIFATQSGTTASANSLNNLFKSTGTA